jgi:hypothetical protein
MKMNKPTNNLSKTQLDLIVKNRKAELYLIDTRKDYYEPLLSEFHDCLRMVKQCIRVRKFPWYVHVTAHIVGFIKDPIMYVKVAFSDRKFLIEDYWELKKLIKEYEIMEKATEDSIEKSKVIINNLQKAIDDKVE